ncbi:cystatin-11 [Cavia porcellus]|uniref:Cystatin domain-containing protein n=1 Tax=Cavia porcellus TaxID=10141 RepID=H0V1S1_CAVPO|nr:cystatin-11 [Cavia porcellus]
MMAGSWKTLKLLLVILTVLVAFSDQFQRKSFIKVSEETAVDDFVPETLSYLNDQYNQDSKDPYSFRIIRVLRVQSLVTDHLEYRILVELWRTKCLKPAFNSSCALQDGKQDKQVTCYFSVYVNPWDEKYKILKKECKDSKFPVTATWKNLLFFSAHSKQG